MKYFFDTEFAEDGRTIDLISIAVVAEDGREFYAVSTEFDADRCNDWVKANVLPKLPTTGPCSAWRPRFAITQDIRAFVRPHRPEKSSYEDIVGDRHDVMLCTQCKMPIYSIATPVGHQQVWIVNGDVPECSKTPEPEFWGYYADYDWVALCQLYGPMVALPKGWPMFAYDLNQWRRQLGLPREALPPDPEGEHDALIDARWVRDAYAVLRERLAAVP